MSIEMEIKKGKVTLPPQVLEHLGLSSGDTLVLDLLPAGRAEVRAKSGHPISRIFGMLKRPGQPVLTIEEINEAAAAGWAGER
ncbi:AbrB/MazE/SpoVT family DNA-binding domain-containing protein [Niveispirillum sp. KHB5.9]|uniref:AbrB/MazE/SpoVT family DNA-binding domain-containing protein n=1 Tax=Niveispirillum sp. KHB5.9 TaxID=3400269 RepID=UPI003A846149